MVHYLSGVCKYVDHVAIVSTQIGQAASMQFNPTMSFTSTPVGNLAMFLALSIFLGSNSHLVVFELLAESFHAVPVDHVVNPINGTKLWLEWDRGISFDRVQNVRSNDFSCSFDQCFSSHFIEDCTDDEHVLFSGLYRQYLSGIDFLFLCSSKYIGIQS